MCFADEFSLTFKSERPTPGGSRVTGNLTPQPDFPHFWCSKLKQQQQMGVDLWNKKHLGETCADVCWP